MSEQAVTESPAFFGGGGRSAMLEQLGHLTAWARSLVIVTGPFGSGKTMLLDRVVARVAEQHHVNVVRPPVGFLSNGIEFLRHVAADLGARVPEQIDAPGLQRLVMQQVVAELAADRSCLLVLDDAHELSASVLSAVVELVDEARDSRGLNVLIAGEPGLPEQLAKATAVRENWHEIRLRPLPLNEARQFLKACRPAALEGLDAAAFQALYRKAGGWPGRMVAQIDGEVRQRRGARRRFPLVHLLWLGAMAGALAVVLVLQHRASSSLQSPPQRLAQPSAQATAQATAQPSARPSAQAVPTDALTVPPADHSDDKAVDTVRLPPLPPLSVPATAGLAGATVIAKDGRLVAAPPPLPMSQRLPVPKAPDSLPDVQHSATPLELAVRAAPVVDAGGETTRVRAVASMPAAQAAPSVVSAVLPVLVPPKPSPAATNRLAAPPMPLPAAGIRATGVPPAGVPPPGIRATGAPTTGVPAPALPPAAGASPGDNGWARGQPAGNFTVQLLGAAAMSTVHKYIAAHPDAELRVLRTRRGSTDWFVVVSGTFQARRDAQAALQRLGVAKAAQPWVRTFAGLQHDLPE